MSGLPKIVLNASTAKIAGGLIVAHDLAYYLSKTSHYRLYLISPNIPKYRNLPGDITKYYSPGILLRPFLRLFMDYLWLPRQIKKIKPDLIVSLGNIPLPVKTPQIILSDNSFIAEKNLNNYTFGTVSRVRHQIRRYLFWNRIRYLNKIIVQTHTEQAKFIHYKKTVPPVQVIPPLFPTHIEFTQNGIDLGNRNSPKSIRLVCASHFFEHKNLDVLIEMLKCAKDKNIPVQLVFTLNEKKKKGGKPFVKKLEKLINDGYVINAGDQSPNKIMHLIKQCDGLILPTLAETFGLNCFEAWHAGIPLFISDLPFAREVCGNAAVFFNPRNPESILTSIVETFANKETIETLISRGLNRLNICSTIEDYVEVINEFIN